MSTSEAGLSWPAVARLSPLSGLSPESLLELRRSAQLGELQPGQDLFRRGTDDAFDYYLVAGTVDLVGADTAESRSLSVAQEGALQPVTVARPRPVTARARTPVRYLKVQSGLLELLGPRDAREGYSVQEFRPDDEAVEGRLLFDIYQAYAEDRLEIPALPELAERIRRAVDDPGNGASEVARVVQADPAIAARLLRVANSALYGGASPARSLREAVVRLGLKATRDLVFAFTVEHAFTSQHSALRRRLLDVWRHSTFVAAIAFTLARQLNGFDPERALLAGLLHDVGAALLVTRADAWPELTDDPAKLQQVIDALRGEIGALLLERWGFQDDLVTAAREAEAWHRDPRPAADLCDIVLLSQLYALRRSGGPANLPDLNAVPAFARLGLAALPPDQVTAMFEDAQKEIGELRRLLLG
jgi:HD-like signal output (HDOD) protein